MQFVPKYSYGKPEQERSWIFKWASNVWQCMSENWNGHQISGDKCLIIERALNVRESQMSWHQMSSESNVLSLNFLMINDVKILMSNIWSWQQTSLASKSLNPLLIMHFDLFQRQCLLFQTISVPLSSFHKQVNRKARIPKIEMALYSIRSQQRSNSLYSACLHA